MGYGLKLLFFFCFVSFVYAVGIFLFTRGFLLKRIVIDEHSECSKVPPVSSDLVGLSNKSGGCWMRGRYKKAVILIIDAFRYDFALYDGNLGENETLPYQNKLKVIHEVMEKSPQQAALFRFVADPPTTTMQRLKGLTTGSLPTFVDAGSNFASTKIMEDNIISQLNSLQKNITFLGDDTWLGLFPESFHKSFPFPSFNVKDLHTVDNGVIRHLVPELNSTDWDVLIGHFLGVDHCGHKYGPYHPAMSNKLIQMDAVIRSVIEVLDEDTILFVMGDHGMTRTGDHGGDSDDELYAALFVYSAKPLTICYSKKDTSSTTTSVSQIDLVPTFSLLLGMPIPFGNLGSIIPDLLCHGLTADTHVSQGHNRGSYMAESVMAKMHRTAAFELNAAQVRRYLTKYASLTAEISQATLTKLVKTLDDATAHSTEIRHLINSYGGRGAFFERATASQLAHVDEKLSAAEALFKDFLSQAKSLCQALWAKFDLVSSFTGIFLLFLNIVVVLLFLCDTPRLVTKISTMVKLSVLATIAGSVFAFFLSPRDIDMPFWSAVSLASGLLLGVAVFTRTSLLQRIGQKPSSWYSLYKPSANSASALVFCFLQCAAMFSNSFVVNEDTQVAFFVQTLFTVKCVQALWQNRELERRKLLMRSAQAPKKLTKERKADAVTTFFFRICLAWAVFVVVNRTALLFRACREEQWTCKPSEFLKPLSVLSEQYYTANNRFVLTVICVGLIPLGARQWLAYQGNLNGPSTGVLCVKFALPFAFVLVCVHWALQIAPQGVNEGFAELLRWQQVFLPRMVYCLCFVTVACLAYSPICVYTVFRGRKSSLTETIQTLQRADEKSKVIHVLFKELKQKWQENIEEQVVFENGTAGNDENTPTVYGLATVYSSALLVLFVAVILPMAMILGDGLALPVFLMCVQMILLLEVHGLCYDVESSRTSDRISDSSSDTVALWVLLACHYFYCTGHQATIPSIKFDAAFVGFPGDMENLVLPGLLIILNTFSGPVLSAVSLPLVLFWHRIPNRLFGTGNKGGRQSDKGEFDWIENPEQLRNHLLRLVLMCQLLHGSKLLATCCAAILHRRHLMVWKIFAPRFVFEGVSFLLTTVVLVVMFLAVLRVDAALRKWFRNLEMSTDQSRAKTQ